MFGLRSIFVGVRCFASKHAESACNADLCEQHCRNAKYHLELSSKSTNLKIKSSGIASTIDLLIEDFLVPSFSKSGSSQFTHQLQKRNCWVNICVTAAKFHPMLLLSSRISRVAVSAWMEKSSSATNLLRTWMAIAFLWSADYLLPKLKSSEATNVGDMIFNLSISYVRTKEVAMYP